MDPKQRVNEYARASLLIDWLKDLRRKPAVTAFTEGPERQVAYALEEALSGARITIAGLLESLDEEKAKWSTGTK